MFDAFFGYGTQHPSRSDVTMLGDREKLNSRLTPSGASRASSIALLGEAVLSRNLNETFVIALQVSPPSTPIVWSGPTFKAVV